MESRSGVVSEREERGRGTPQTSRSDTKKFGAKIVLLRPHFSCNLRLGSCIIEEPWHSIEGWTSSACSHARQLHKGDE